MAKKMYIGVSDVARKVSKMYVGVNGVARKVKKAYVGINGVAQQFYESGYNVTISPFYSSMRGQSFNIYNGSTLVTTLTFPSSGACYWDCSQTGTYTLKTSDNTCGYSFTINDLTTVTNVTWYATSLRKTFAIATDKEIREMVTSADRTGLSLYTDCAWRVGQEHTVSMLAIPSGNGCSESHSAQNAVWELMHKNGYSLTISTASGKTVCDFAVGMKNCFNEKGYMSSAHSTRNVWKNNQRRAWCRNTFPNSLPSDFLAIFKSFKASTGKGYPSQTVITLDETFIPFSQTELANDTSRSWGAEGVYMTYYQTSSNRAKYVGSSTNWYWNRTPHNASDVLYTVVSPQGVMGSAGSPTETTGISVYGVI